MKSTNTKKIIIIVLVAALLPLLFACTQEAPAANSSALVVNEIVSSNKRSLVDENLGTPDWIELYNSGTAPLDLSGYGISDNMRDLHKYVVPEGTVLNAGDYLVLYAMSASEDTQSPYITNFGLSKSGDYLFITDAYFGLVTQMEIPVLYTDVSYARAADGTFGYSGVPTPGAENTGEIYMTLSGVFAAQNLSALSISEVMPTDDATGYRWVELYNNGSRQGLRVHLSFRTRQRRRKRHTCAVPAQQRGHDGAALRPAGQPDRPRKLAGGRSRRRFRGQGRDGRRCLHRVSDI